MTIISPLLRGLCDDAALFPPGNAPLTEAIPAHAAYLQADYDALVGPFVFPAPRLGELAAYVSADSPVTLSLTVPAGPSDTAAALSNALAILVFTSPPSRWEFLTGWTPMRPSRNSLVSMPLIPTSTFLSRCLEVIGARAISQLSKLPGIPQSFAPAGLSPRRTRTRKSSPMR